MSASSELGVGSWKPRSFEDRLLNAYVHDSPGRLFLEVRVGGSEDPLSARRIDGILIPGAPSRVLTPQDYSSRQVQEAVEGEVVHLIEAKRTLNRNVIGQILAGADLFDREFNPDRIERIALCATGEPDLEWVCEQRGVEVVLYPISTPESEVDSDATSSEAVHRMDVRKEPDRNRRTAFLAGWTAAVEKQLYATVRKRKTHANMGNLFGWIYGDQDYDFRVETWDRYIESFDAVERSDEVSDVS